MKYMKMLGLAAVAAAALMAFVGAGTASATVLCKEAKTTGCAVAGQDYPAGTAIEATLNGSLEFVGGGFIEDTCTSSTLKGTTSSTGGAAATVTGHATSWTWANCIYLTTTTKLGTFEIHHIAGTDNGTFTISGFEVTIHQTFGSCTYKSGTGNDVGILKGGNPASITFSTTVTGGGAFGCPSTATLTAAFTITKPVPLYVSAS